MAGAIDGGDGGGGVHWNLKTIEMKCKCCMDGSKCKETISPVRYLKVFITLVDFVFGGMEGGRGGRVG